MATTGFEDRGLVAPWTTFPEEAAFVASLLGESANVSRTVWGQSVGGADMYTLTIGTGPIDVLIIAQQHGLEVSGRDALLTRIRDWAQAPTQAVTDYLTQVTLHVMPSAHPDNQTQRYNLNGEDVGRNHLVLTEPESRAIQSAIRTLDPSVVIDLHEGRDITNEAASLPSLNSNVHSAIAALSRSLDDSTEATVTGGGWTWEPYRHGRTVEPQNLCNNTGLSNRVSMLFETRRSDLPGGGPDHSDATDRYSIMCAIIDNALTWHAANLIAVEQAVATARADMLTYHGQRRLEFGEAASDGPIIDVPVGYRVTNTQWADLEHQRTLLGITSEPHEDGGRLIPTGQWAQQHLVYVLDPASEIQVVPATRVETPRQPWIGHPLVMKVQTGGERYDVVSARFRLNDITHYVTV